MSGGPTQGRKLATKSCECSESRKGSCKMIAGIDGSGQELHTESEETKWQGTPPTIVQITVSKMKKEKRKLPVLE